MKNLKYFETILIAGEYLKAVNMAVFHYANNERGKVILVRKISHHRKLGIVILLHADNCSTNI